MLTAAIGYHEELGQHGWVPDWASQHDYCRHSLYLAGHTEVLEIWGGDVASYPTKISDATYVKGLAYFGEWGSLRYATGAAFSAALYFEATGDATYRDFAASQLAYVMGQNEYQRSFVVGFGNNPPKNPHHANAYGYEALDWDLSKPALNSLDGALVAGPTKTAAGVSTPGYEDMVSDWVGNEVTIDYNTGLVGVAAFARKHPCAMEGWQDPPTDPPVDPPTDPPVDSTIGVTFEQYDDWGSGFLCNIVIGNSGAQPVNDWTLQCEISEFIITSAWSSEWWANGAQNHWTPVSWTAEIPAGGSVTLGFEASGVLTQSSVQSCTLNGASVAIAVSPLP